MRYTIGPIPSTDAALAFACHRRLAATDPHLFPRTAADIRLFAENSELFGVREATSRQLVGLNYVVLDQAHKPPAWEIGGLTVDPACRGSGLGLALVGFSLAHTLTFQMPWANGQIIVAHIHAENNNPRGIFQRLMFRYSAQVEIPGHRAPASMKRNAKGTVVGDELRFDPEGVPSLLDALSWGESGQLHNGDEIVVERGAADIKQILRALREL